MKVLQINSVCGVGSTGRIAIDIHDALKQQGHESYIAYGRNTSINCDNSIKIGTKYDNYVHLALTRVFDQHGFGSKKATLNFIKKIEDINPDIIHLHNIHGYYINIKILFDYLKNANKSVVWTLHDCWAFTGHCSHFDYVACEKWKTECRKCPQTEEYPKSIMLDNSQKNYLNKKEIFAGVNNLTLITPSNWLARLVKESFLGEYPIEVINNGINLEAFKPTQSNFREKNNLNNKFIILGVASNWRERKGYHYFIELSKRINKNEIIVLVGLDNKQKQSLPDNILGITKTNNINELAEIYSASDVLFNPTLEDNFPTVNIEAMSCGLPVVTFKTGGAVEQIRDGCGIIVPKGDIEKSLEAINNIKVKRKSEFYAKCLKHVNNNYSRKVAYEKYINLYKKVVG